jgi:hypothetical protein
MRCAPTAGSQQRRSRLRVASRRAARDLECWWSRLPRRRRERTMRRAGASASGSAYTDDVRASHAWRVATRHDDQLLSSCDTSISAMANVCTTAEAERTPVRRRCGRCHHPCQRSYTNVDASRSKAAGPTRRPGR